MVDIGVLVACPTFWIQISRLCGLCISFVIIGLVSWNGMGKGRLGMQMFYEWKWRKYQWIESMEWNGIFDIRSSLSILL
jgi:hypothetical protein